MNTTTEPKTRTRDPEELWSVVVLYEDAATRQRAMKVCDHLVQQFWAEVEFKFHWWRTDFLEDDTMAATAATDASNADFIVVSSSAERELSPFVKNWFEAWIARRQGREGAFVDLTETGAVSAARVQHNKIFLRTVARRAAMDYLTKIPSVINGKLPDSVESVDLRAGQITSVLDNILHQPPPPHLDLQPRERRERSAT